MATGGVTVRDSDVAYDFVCTKCSDYNEATLYCPSCDVFYCTPCLRIICGHALLGRNEVHRWGKTPLTPSEDEECDVHKGHRLGLYCREHDVVCCGMCFPLSHRDCDMEYVPDVANQAEVAELKRKADQTIQQLRRQLDTVKQNTATRQAGVQSNKTTSAQTIRRYTLNMVLKLRAMEEAALADLEKHTKDSDDKLLADLEVYNDTGAELEMLEQTVETCKNDKDDVQSFIKLKKTQHILNVKQSEVAKLDKEQLLIHDSNAYQIDKKIEAAVSNFTKLGCFKNVSGTHLGKTDVGPVHVSPDACRFRAVNRRDIAIDIRQDEYYTCNIIDMCELPGNYFVISDNKNKKLKQLDPSYKVICHRSLPSSPLGVCCINDHEVAVILVNRTIQFVSVGSKMRLTHYISLDHGCRGITHHKGRLYVTGNGHDSPPVYVYSLSGRQLHTYRADQNGHMMFEKPRDIAFSHCKNIMYIVDHVKGLVTIDTQGNLLSTLKRPDLRHPVGICVADDGSVFVGGFGSHNVIQVGKKGDRMLTEVVSATGGIAKPNGICIVKQGSGLVVCMEESNKLAVFDLVQKH